MSWLRHLPRPWFVRAAECRIIRQFGGRITRLTVIAATFSFSAHAYGQVAAQDPFTWLEDIHGARSMAWVRQQNMRTAARLERDPRFAPYRDEALALFTSTDRLATPIVRAGGVDNVWQDKINPHGLWRHASVASFRTRTPQWDPLLDLDALSKSEGKSWFWKGADCLEPEERRCLVRLSNGGGDAVEVREFDTLTKQFVVSGFAFAAGKQAAEWIDKDTLIVARPWTPEQTTMSGYPFVLKLVHRGQSLSQAVPVFSGKATDGGGVNATTLRDGDGALRATLLTRSINDYDHLYYLLKPKQAGPTALDLPRKSEIHAYVAGQLTFTIQQDWRGFLAGDLLSYDLTQAVLGAPRLIFRPTPHQSIDQVSATRDHLIVVILQDVTGEALDFGYGAGRWTSKILPLPTLSAVSISATSPISNLAFLTSAGFLDPTALWICDAAEGSAESIKSSPPQFDGTHDVVEQFWAISKDGARIPYFVVHPLSMKPDGSTPTQMFGYGGFLISEPPVYRPELGKLWLEKGGAYVLANIRGGGEFGPAWHDAALRENRQRAFDDFAAVAQDLFAKKITSPRRLGIYGRSNGGLLASVSLTQHPEYWNAVVIESPLVDMLRYNHLSAGASWTGEYGDPDVPSDRAFIAKYSAYQALRSGVRYPEPYITTNTEDDRVHPGHARKLAAKLQSLGDPYLYYEETFGGHSNDADPELNARRWARHYVYLSQKLMD